MLLRCSDQVRQIDLFLPNKHNPHRIGKLALIVLQGKEFVADEHDERGAIELRNGVVPSTAPLPSV